MKGGDSLKSTRTTIVIDDTLLARLNSHVAEKKNNGEKDDLSKLFHRGLVNQLEREGDFEIRDILEEEKKNGY